MAKDLKGIVKVYAVNCDADKDLCKEHDIKGFPTIKIFPPGLLGTQVYEGERDAKSITKFATRFMNNYVVPVKSDTEAGFLNSNAATAKVLLFTDKPNTPLMYKVGKNRHLFLHHNNFCCRDFLSNSKTS